MRGLDMLEKSAVRKLAKKHGWTEEVAKDPTVLIFNRYVGGKQQVNVWYTTGTVATSLKHPNKGRTQLYRKSVTMELLAKIFENPRVHTDLGYYSR